MRASTARRAGLDAPFAPNEDETAAAAWKYNLGSCHVWAEDGEQVRQIQRGEEIEVPLSIQRRMRELGQDPDAWRTAAT
jgi:hypothetical protein